MAVYERSTLVRAPLDDVWAFHATVDGLVELTPDWLGMTVEAVRGPDGEADPEVLEVGSEVDLSLRPLGVGPRQRWTSRIVARERSDDAAEFRDEMLDGPFARWHHTHRFQAVPEGTRVIDRVEYALPLGPLRWRGRAGTYARGRRHRLDGPRRAPYLRRAHGRRARPRR